MPFAGWIVGSMRLQGNLNSMKKLLSILAITVLLVSCGSPKGPINTGDQMVELKGHYMHNDVKERIYAGGMFRMNEVEEFKNLYPLSIVDVV